MANVLAIVSKAVFEKQARVDGARLELGGVWPVGAYNSKNKRLDALTEDDALFLVTVRPGEEPWLVGILERPQFDGDRWTARTNTEPARGVTEELGRLTLDNGKGLQAKPGKLGMSLQTPRILTAADAALLRGSTTSPSRAKPTPKSKPKPKPKSKSEPVAVPSGASRPLVAALTSLREDNRLAALDHLLDAWGSCKAVATAEAIESLGAIVDRSLEPFSEALSAKAFEESWLDLAGRRRAADVGRLIRSAGRGSARAMKGFFEQLRQFKPDPRVAWLAISQVAWYSSTGAGPARTAGYRLAEWVGDGRVAHLPLDLTPEQQSAGLWRKQIDEWLVRLRKKVAPPPEPSPDDRVVLDAISGELARLEQAEPPTEDALFAQPGDAGEGGEPELIANVLAEPSDAAARLVYGDWLSERQDPRGQVIALQHKEEASKLTGKERKQIRDAIKAHGSKWMHPLDAVVKKPRFSLGFLSGCGEVAFRTKKQKQELVDHPLWATVEEIDACNFDGLLVGGALRSLKRLNTSASVLAELTKHQATPALEEVTATWFDRDYGATTPRLSRYMQGGSSEVDRHVALNGADAWSTFTKVGSLGTVTRLRVHAPDYYPFADGFAPTADGFAWLVGSKLGRQLEFLELAHEDLPLELGGWLEVLAKMKRLETFEIFTTPPYQVGGLTPAGGRRTPGSACEVRWRFRPKADPKALELDLGWPYFKDALRPIARIFAANLAGFPHAKVTTARVRYTGKRGAAYDLARLSDDVAELLGPKFDRLELPDGRVS